MKPQLSILLVTALASCAKHEEGIDRTIVRGNVVVPPASFDEPTDGGMDANDLWEEADELPAIHYRKLVLNGHAASFGGVTYGQLPDYDYYTISAESGGTITVSLDYPTSPGMGRDRTFFEVYLYDLGAGEEACETDVSCTCDCACEATWDDCNEECVVGEDCEEECDCQPVESTTCVPVAVAGGNTNESMGHYAFDYEVQADGAYGILVVAADSSEYENGADYTLSFNSLTPSDTTFLVGAYLSEDPATHGDPLGGGSVFDLTWDQVHEAWVGRFEVLYLRSVVSTETCADEMACTCDCGCAATYEESSGTCTMDPDCTYEGEEECTCEPEVREVCTEDHEVTEGVPGGKVWLMGGSMDSVNSAILSGTLFSSAAVEVAIAAGDEEVVIGGWGDSAEPEPVDTSDSAYELEPPPVGDIVVILDTLQPLVRGWDYTEEEPNDCALNTDYSLPVEEEANANVLPDPMGLPYTDFIFGAAPLDIEAPVWDAAYNDLFALTMVEGLNATITLGWDDCDTDLDLHLYDAEGVLQSVSWYGCPESISTAADGLALDAGTTWYIAVLPYAGSVGEHPYSVEIEYAPR